MKITLEQDNITVGELIKTIHEKFGGNCDYDKITLDIEYRQYKCFGYDLYDPDDFQIEMDISDE
jgi:hypothetical protein